MSTEGDRSTTPLAAVTEALERAVGRSELSRQDLEWSVARLAGRPAGGSGHADGGRRDEVVQAGARVFRRRGYANATMEEVAAEVSLTKAAIYHYFKSKEALLEAVVEASVVAVDEAVDAAVHAPGSAADRLRAVLEVLYDAVLDDDGLRVAMTNLDTVPDHPEIARRRRRTRALVVRLLEDGEAAGDFEPLDARVAFFAMAGAVSWMPSWYTPQGPRSRAEVRDAIVAQVMNGILARRP